MLKVAVTGNIGSGKSYVLGLFQLLGIPLFYADAEAKRLLVEDDHIQTLLQEATQQQAFLADGTLNKPLLISLLISDTPVAQKLNHSIHLAAIQRFEQWCDNLRTLYPPPPYCIKEAAILFEADIPQDLDYIIGVDAPTETRRQRYLSRPGSSLAHFERIEKQQLPSAEKMKRVHRIIHNDYTTSLLPQVLDIHHYLLKKNETPLTL